VSAQPDLQAEITALAAFPIQPESAWVARVQSSTIEVIAGAMLIWVTRSGVTMVGGDPMAPRREAAQAILQARLADQAVNSTAQLRNTIDDYQQKSGRLTTVMLVFTIVITLLTLLQIVMALKL
jgi:hypothetical protein